MSEAPSLQRFIDAQNMLYGSSVTCYQRALAELKQGEKQSHWMWFIFPQLDGLGSSRTSSIYGLKGVRETVDYVHHTDLRRRYIKVLRVVREQATDYERVLEDLFSGRLDTMKFVSSITVFRGASAWVLNQLEEKHLLYDELSEMKQLCEELLDIAKEQEFQECNMSAIKAERFRNARRLLT